MVILMQIEKTRLRERKSELWQFIKSCVNSTCGDDF